MVEIFHKSSSDVSIGDTERWARERSEQSTNTHGVYVVNIGVAPFFAVHLFPKSTQHTWGV